MSLTLYAHPFSSYCQKVLIALYENDDAVRVPPARARRRRRRLAEHAALWPLKRMPVLVDERPHRGRGEHHHRAPRSSSSRAGAADPRGSARRARRAHDGPLLRQLRHDADAEDRVRRASAPQSTATRTASPRRAQLLDTAYRWLDGALAGREWAAGGAFSLADCAAAPVAVLCRLGAPDRRRLPACPRLSPPPARAAVVRARGRRGAAVPAALSPRRAGPGLAHRADTWTRR